MTTPPQRTVTEREAQTNRVPFYKFMDIGQALAGYIARHGTNDNGAFIEFAPVLERKERGNSWEKRDAIAVGLGTDLSMKINGPNDTGRFIMIEFVDTEPSKRGQPKKIFRVVELTRTEIIGLRDGTFIIPDAPPRKTPERATDEEDLF